MTRIESCLSASVNCMKRFRLLFVGICLTGILIAPAVAGQMTECSGPLSSLINPRNYGVLANWKEFWSTVAAMTVTMGSTAITCTGCFNPATDVGKEIIGSNCNITDVGCGMTGLELFAAGTVISSISNANTAVVSAPAIKSISTTGYLAFGTNDDAAWTAADTAFQALNTCGTVIFPAGISNFDNINKFTTPPANCTTIPQGLTALTSNAGPSFIGYGAGTSVILLTPAFASHMGSCAATGCLFSIADSWMQNIGFKGGGNSYAGQAAPCTSCSIIPANSGTTLSHVRLSGFGGGAISGKMVGLGGLSGTRGGVFATYDDVIADGFGNYGVQGANSIARGGYFVDNWFNNFTCNSFCWNYSVGYGNGTTFALGGVLYDCLIGPCYSTGDYMAYGSSTSPTNGYQVFQTDYNAAITETDLYVTNYSNNTANPGQTPPNQNWLYAQSVLTVVHVKNSDIFAGTGGHTINPAAPVTVIEEAFNNVSGPIQLYNSSTIWIPYNSVTGICTGVATASQTQLALNITGLTTSGLAIPTACTSTALDKGQPMTHSGTLRYLQVEASAAGVLAASGVVTVMKNGVATALTCTMGTATFCFDGTDTATFAQGDLISYKFTSQAGETLAGLKAIVSAY